MTYSNSTPIKVCPKCSRIKPETEFYKAKNTRDGLKSWCKKCFNADVVNRNRTKPKYRQNQRRWESDNREHRRRYFVQYYAKHLERHHEYSRNNYRKHKMSELTRTRNGYVKRKGAIGTHNASDIRRLFAKQRGKCAYCECDISNQYHVDHVIPLSRGGTNYPDNLALACPHCNLSKNNKLLSEWRK